MSATADSPSTSEPLPPTDTVLRQAGAENFPVALAVLGARVRRRLMAIYGFARLVDDTGDEAAGDRSALLDRIAEDLRTIYGGGSPEHPLMRTLAVTVRECRLPEGPFQRLIQANRQDQVVSRYETFEALLGYCQLSAAPVGELVLHVFGQATDERVALSDLVCAGLQVIEHLQDVREDYGRGRIYLPLGDLRRFGAVEEDLVREPVPVSVRRAMEFETGRAGALLQAGDALVRQLSGRARVAVAGFVAGGHAALRGLEETGYDISRPEPVRDRRAFAWKFAAAVAGR